MFSRRERKEIRLRLSNALNSRSVFDVFPLEKVNLDVEGFSQSVKNVLFKQLSIEEIALLKNYPEIAVAYFQPVLSKFCGQYPEILNKLKSKIPDLLKLL